MLDAGPLPDFEKKTHLRPVYELPYRGLGDPNKVPHVFQANEFNANQWAGEKANPYTHAVDEPYNWVRVRMLGGKSLFWARMSFRLSNYEFKAKDLDGFGENWPIEYNDLAPYYDRVETIFRVTGRKEGLEQLPDGPFVEDNSAYSGSIQRMIDAAKNRGIAATKVRRSLGEGRLASSFNLTLPRALATGKLDILENAVARAVTLDERTGRANGVRFVDRRSGRELHAKAKVVMLGASCLESTRLLLNSGIANSSGTLGHYLMDQFYVGGGVQAIVTEARDGKAPRGLMGGGGYLPRFRNLKGGPKSKDFIRGYSADFYSGGSPDAQYFPLYGSELEKELASTNRAGLSMTTMGDVLPRYENHVRISDDVVDAWGIPALHISTKYTDNEFNMARDAKDTLSQLVEDAGFELLSAHDQMWPPGYSIHELGTCRMGTDPKKSVLNKWNQSHDVANLFVVDGSSFVSAGSQNPTITIMALALRAAEYAAEELRQGNL
jgi:choline dehydrogenase-like flavoprotein